MKKGIIWLIGILAIINGIIGCVYPPLLAIYSPETISLKSIQYVLSTWILIYGGYQTLRRSASGPKLLRIFFCIESIKLITAVLFTAILFLIVTNKIEFKPELNEKPITSIDSLASFYLVFYVAYCILSFIFLSQKNVTEDFLADNSQNTKKVVKILSVIAPGLGQAFVGKYWSGIIRFLIFYALLSGLHPNISMEISFIQIDNEMVAKIGENIGKLLIWAFFSHDDRAVAYEELKNQQEQAAQATIEEPPA